VRGEEAGIFEVQERTDGHADTDARE
jgi:hypothetical protein